MMLLFKLEHYGQSSLAHEASQTVYDIVRLFYEKIRMLMMNFSDAGVFGWQAT